MVASECCHMNLGPMAAFTLSIRGFIRSTNDLTSTKDSASVSVGDFRCSSELLTKMFATTINNYRGLTTGGMTVDCERSPSAHPQPATLLLRNAC